MIFRSADTNVTPVRDKRTKTEEDQTGTEPKLEYIEPELEMIEFSPWNCWPIIFNDFHLYLALIRLNCGFQYFVGNVPKLLKMAPNNPEWPDGQKWSQLTSNDQKWPERLRMTLNGLK